MSYSASQWDWPSNISHDCNVGDTHKHTFISILLLFITYNTRNIYSESNKILHALFALVGRGFPRLLRQRSVLALESALLMGDSKDRMTDLLCVKQITTLCFEKSNEFNSRLFCWTDINLIFLYAFLLALTCWFWLHYCFRGLKTSGLGSYPWHEWNLNWN